MRFRDSDDRVAVLAAAEDAYFSVGADVKDLPVNMWHAVPGLGVELDKPVIAATSGWVVGGGFVLVQMADMCVASETTRFIYPEAKIGTTAGGVSSVVARMPHKIAMEFLLVGEELSAERAYQIGFVNKIAPKGQHVVLAQEMAQKIAGNAPLVVQALKKLARDVMPKGPLETVAEVRRLLDDVRRERRPQGGRQGLQRKAQAPVQRQISFPHAPRAGEQPGRRQLARVCRITCCGSDGRPIPAPRQRLQTSSSRQR